MEPSTDRFVAPFHTVDEPFARDEGEGDGSLAHWIDVHERFFRDRCQVLGIEFSPQLEVVFEHFDLAWAPDESPDHGS